MPPSRRDFVLGCGATLAAAQSSAAASNGNVAAGRLLAGFTEELLVEYPESATMLGIDKGARAGLKSRLLDRSAAGQKAIAIGVARRLEQLKTIDTTTLDEATRIDVDVMRTAHEFALEGFAFPYGDVALLNSQWSWRNAPYVVAQNTGAFLEIPGMLDEQHTVETRADAEAYLARLEAYASQLDGETGRLRADAAQNVIAPDFLLDKTLKRAAARSRNGHWSLRWQNAPSTCPGCRPAQRRLPARRSLRRSTGRSRSWKRIVDAPAARRVSGNCRAGTSTTPGRCAPAPPHV
jgi:uncharacterized protein (DUF885 family)